MAKIKGKITKVGKEIFDSKTEAEFYLLLKADKSIKRIERQPQYILLESFAVPCKKCRGIGKVKSPRTSRDIQCRTCKGLGTNSRQPWTYTADFLVTYLDDHQEVIDVKGGYKDVRFPHVKKMFEYTTGRELVVWSKDDKKGWVRS